MSYQQKSGLLNKKIGCFSSLCIICGIGMLIICAGVISNLPDSPPRQRKPSKDASQTVAASKEFSNLTARDIYERFTRQGFSLESRTDAPFEDSGTSFPAQTIWTCKKEIPLKEINTVEVFGESESRITMIRATYINTSSNDSNTTTDRGSSDFLTSFSTLPVVNLQPKEVSSWINTRIGENAEKEVGSAIYELFANTPRNRTLLIVPSDSAIKNPNEIEDTPEEKDRKAQNKLQLAKKVITEGKSTLGKKWLNEIINDFPNTEAASEAAQLIESE